MLTCVRAGCRTGRYERGWRKAFRRHSGTLRRCRCFIQAISIVSTMQWWCWQEGGRAFVSG